MLLGDNMYNLLFQHLVLTSANWTKSQIGNSMLDEKQKYALRMYLQVVPVHGLQYPSNFRPYSLK